MFRCSKCGMIWTPASEDMFQQVTHKCETADVEQLRADLGAARARVERYEAALRAIAALKMDTASGFPPHGHQAQQDGMWCDGPCTELAREALGGGGERSESEIPRIVCPDIGSLFPKAMDVGPGMVPILRMATPYSFWMVGVFRLIG